MIISGCLNRTYYIINRNHFGGVYMAEVFEDKLMNLQERIVSTCLEALEG